MSRKAELQAEENVANSPLRRSSRLSLSAAEATVKPIKTRRSSASSENNDFQEKPENKSIRTRRGSVTKDEPEKKSSMLTRRRSSVTEESQHDTPILIRSRKTSHNDSSDGKGSNVKSENKKSLSGHRSPLIVVEKLESNGKRTVRTRRRSLDLEQCPPETKRVTRSRRSSVDISEEVQPQTPKLTKVKKPRSPLEPVVDKVPVVILTPVKKNPEQQQGDLNLSVIEELSFTEEKIPEEIETITPVKKNPEQQQGDLNLSLIEELSFTEEKIPDDDDKQRADSNLKSEEKLTPPKRKSPRFSKDAEAVEENKKTEEVSGSPKTKSNKLSKDCLDKANEIRSSNSKMQNGKSIDSPKSCYLNLSNNDSIQEVEVTDKLSIQSESYEDISSHTNIRTSPTTIQHGTEDKSNMQDSTSPITHKSREESKEYSLNTSTGSNNSDKENICRSDDFATKDKFNIVSQGVQVKRISNVFRPKQIDHSFVEPMEIDESSMLNDTRVKPECLDQTNINPEKAGRESIDGSIDESFNLCLNVTNAEQSIIFRKSPSENKLNESGQNDGHSKEEIDVEELELPKENKETLESIKEEIQEKTIGKLSEGAKLENEIVKAGDSSDYEFHLETDEEDLDAERLKDGKCIESKNRNVSTELLKVDSTEDIEIGFKDNIESGNNDINIENCQDRPDQSFIADHENNKKIGNIDEIENLEHMSSTKMTTDIQVKEGKPIKPDRKSSSDITTEQTVSVSDNLVQAEASCSIANQDVPDEKFKIGSDKMSNTEVANKKEIMKKSDLNTVVNSDLNIEVSEIINNIQCNTNKDINIIKSDINREDINRSDSDSILKTKENIPIEKNIQHSNTNQIPLRNSILTIDNTSEQSISTSDSTIFSSVEDKLIHITEVNDQNKKQLISSAGGSNENCTEGSKSEDVNIEIDNSEMVTAGVISSECLESSDKNNIEKLETPTLSNIEVVDSETHDIPTDFEYSKENFDGGNIAIKLRNNMESNHTKNRYSNTEFEVDNADSNLSVSRATTPKYSANNPSNLCLYDSSPLSEKINKDSMKSHSPNTNSDLNIGPITTDGKLSVNHRDSEQLAFNVSETTEIISKDQNMELDSKQGDIDGTNSESDLLSNKGKELNNKIVDSNELRKKTKQIKQNSDDEYSTIEIGDVSKSKLDAFLDRRLSEMYEGSDNDDCDDTNERNEFINDMAEEGEEDTPSEDSNQIIDEGESINSTESEIDSDEDYDDNDSFICDEEEIELLSGEEYDLDQETVKRKKKSRIIDVENYENEDVIRIKKKDNLKKGKERKSRIINVEDCDDDVIIVEKVKIKDPEVEKMPIINVEDSGCYTKGEKSVNENKMQRLEFTDTSNFSKTGETVMQKEPAVTRKSSITVHENISVTSSTDEILSHRINSLVESFCSKIHKGDISLNLSLEYDGQSKTEDAVLNRNNSDTKPVDRDDKVIAEPPVKKLKLSSDLTDDTTQTPNNYTRNVIRKRKKRNHHSEKQPKKMKTKDLRSETFSLMNQLITDVKNRPLRTVKPSTSKVDMNNSWIVDIVEITPSTSVVSKEEIDRFKRKKVHPKDFRQQMLYDSSRVKRMETKTLLKKRGAYK